MPHTPTKSANSSPPDASPAAGARRGFLIGGVACSTLAVGVLAGLLLFFTRVKNTSTLEASVTVPGSFLLTKRQTEIVSLLIAAPGVLLLLAAIAFFFYVLLNRATVLGIEQRQWWKGGSVTAQMKPLETRYHLAWIAAAVLAWLLLIVLPVLLASGGAWPATLDDTQAGFTFMTLGFYGALSATLAVILTVSLIKKTTYRAVILKRGEGAMSGGGGKSFWRWFTFRWRFDLWLAGVGGALIGTCWMALMFGDTVFFLTALCIGLFFTAAGLLTAVQYWRAGEPLGRGESFT